MKGRNEIKLNQASMCEAVQYWLNSVLTEPDMVVIMVDAEIMAGIAEFTIRIEKKPLHKEVSQGEGEIIGHTER